VQGVQILFGAPHGTLVVLLNSEVVAP